MLVRDRESRSLKINVRGTRPPDQETESPKHKDEGLTIGPSAGKS